VADAPAQQVLPTAGVGPVTFYTASLCPFCPLMRRRLADLQQQMHFELREIDLTFRPDLVRAKRLRSVPVVEAGGQVLTGNATSRQLALFLTGSITSV
jgi:glutaredoxin